MEEFRSMHGMNIPQWLKWARDLQAISQSGLHFTSDDFDRERYEKIRHIAANIMEHYTDMDAEVWLDEFQQQKGYATPKVTVRAAVFKKHQILLVRENSDGGWSMPGGWADLNDPPSKMVEREVCEESGFTVRASKLISVHESNHDQQPFIYWHSYKLVFLCDLIGGAAKPSIETSEIDFFDINNLPPLSPLRTSMKDIEEAFYYLDHPEAATYFD